MSNKAITKRSRKPLILSPAVLGFLAVLSLTNSYRRSTSLSLFCGQPFERSLPVVFVSSPQQNALKESATFEVRTLFITVERVQYCRQHRSILLHAPTSHSRYCFSNVFKFLLHPERGFFRLRACSTCQFSGSPSSFSII